MAKSKRVAEFMNALFQKTITKQNVISTKPVEFLRQSKRRNYRTGATYLRFPKNIF